ncbi:MAG: heavy-metal-associated domain-containing protein [Anaerolineaceae bacterium]
MKTVIIELPTMYGDHHVIEVRRILMAIPGVEEIYASSRFGMVEVKYDPEKVNDLEIAMKLDEAGYLGEWSIPVETTETTQQEVGRKPFFRHTAVYETTRQVVSFSQVVNTPGKPLWPCPGMGIIKPMKEED